MGLSRQAHVQRSYGMVPLRRSKAPLPTFSLVNSRPSLFLLSPRAQDGNVHMQRWKLTRRLLAVFLFKINVNLKERVNVSALVEGGKHGAERFILKMQYESNRKSCHFNYIITLTTAKQAAQIFSGSIVRNTRWLERQFTLAHVNSVS